MTVPLDPARQRRHKLRNLFHSVVLLGGMAGLLALCTWPLVGLEGLLWILLGAAIGLALSPRVSPRYLLAAYRARELGPHECPQGFDLLQGLSRRAGLHAMPRLYYIPSAVLNAFSLGGGGGTAIALTDGLLRRLTLRELAGVLAHELSHIRNNDLWIMTLADTISRLTVLMAYGGLVFLVAGLPFLVIHGKAATLLLVLPLLAAPTLAALLQLALSRAREYDADLDAAGLTGDPRGLAEALGKLEFYQGRLWERILLPGRRLPDPSLLRSHPATEERIKRLLALRPPAPAEGFHPAEPFDLPHHPTPVRRRPRMHLPGTWY